jgi:hypothetical protein
MAHENRDRIVRNVVAAVVAVGTVAGGLLVASQQEGRDVTDDTHVRIFEADEVLRGQGKSEAEIVSIVRQRTGADVAPDGAVVADVVRAAHRKDRDPRTIRSVALVMPTPVELADGFDAAWGAIYCDPLRPVKVGDSTDLYDECVAQQVGSLGPLLCLADGTPAGHVTRIQATPALAERAAALVGEVPETWVPCPQPDIP